MALPQSAGQTAGHQPTNAAGLATAGLIDRQPLALVRQQLLEHGQGHARFHRDGQVVDGMVDHTIEMPAAQHRVIRIQGSPPAEMVAQATGNPGC